MHFVAKFVKTPKVREWEKRCKLINTNKYCIFTNYRARQKCNLLWGVLHWCCCSHVCCCFCVTWKSAKPRLAALAAAAAAATAASSSTLSSSWVAWVCVRVCVESISSHQRHRETLTKKVLAKPAAAGNSSSSNSAFWLKTNRKKNNETVQRKLAKIPKAK